MIPFSTVAANADVIGDDTPMAEPRRSPGEQQRGAAERGRHERGRERSGAPEPGAARPGQDINAPGFVRDKDTGTPE